MMQLTASVYAILSDPDMLSQSTRTSMLSEVQAAYRGLSAEAAVGAAVTVDRVVQRANAMNETVNRTMVGKM